MTDRKKQNKGLEYNIKMYKASGEDYYFNLIWKDVKYLAKKLGNSFNQIDIDDRESFAQESLWISLDSLEEGRNLLTLFGKVYKNKLLDEAVKYKTKKETMNSGANSLDAMYEETNFEVVDNTAEFNIKLFNEEIKANEQERKIIGMLYEGYKVKEIQKRLDLKPYTYRKTITTIQNKVQLNYLKI